MRLRKTAEPEPAAGALPEDVSAEYFLWDSSPIQDAPSIDAATAERFRKIGVLLVRDLLHIDVQDAAQRLRHAGITAGMLERWRAEALLVCRVPRLRPYDARILVACGVSHPDQLARLEADELRRRVESFAATDLGRVMLQSGTHYELARLTDWIHSARRQRPSRPQAAGPRPDTARPRGHEHPRSGQRDRTRPAAERQFAPRPPREPQTNPARSEPQTPAVPPAAPVVLKLDQRGGPAWRFHLELNDPLENAPSIGPRMAERLAQAGIRTVAEFLRADARQLAGQVGLRRLTADTLRQWQQQTTLACRIPELRGHDAQILVACGITDPEQLARADADTLWGTVESFVQTTEGKRLLRNAKQPDLQEVRAWIEWARHARLLKAA